MTSIRKNIAYLMLAQGASYLFPFITLPYLGRVLGPGNFGLLVFCQGVMQYFVLLTDYGFNLTATRQIAIYRGNRQQQDRVFFETTAAKLMLAVACCAMVLFLTLIVPKFHDSAHVIYACIPMVIGNALFPLWYFQGLETMKMVVMTSSVAKMLLLLSTFVFVRTRDDVVIAALLQGGGNMLAACIALTIIWHQRLVLWHRPTLAGIVNALREGWPIFISTVAVTFYTTLNVVLLGFTQGNISAGYFGAAEKIRLALQGLMSPFSQAFFPRLSSHNEMPDEVAKLFAKAKRVILGASFLLGLATYLFAGRAVTLYMGPAFAPSIDILKLMAILLPIIGLATLYGHLGLLARGYSRLLSRIYVSGSILHVLYVYAFLHWFGVIGLVVAVITTETIITAAMYVAFRGISRSKYAPDVHAQLRGDER